MGGRWNSGQAGCTGRGAPPPVDGAVTGATLLTPSAAFTLACAVGDGPDPFRGGGPAGRVLGSGPASRRRRGRAARRAARPAAGNERGWVGRVGGRRGRSVATPRLRLAVCAWARPAPWARCSQVQHPHHRPFQAQATSAWTPHCLRTPTVSHAAFSATLSTCAASSSFRKLSWMLYCGVVSGSVWDGVRRGTGRRRGRQRAWAEPCGGGRGPGGMTPRPTPYSEPLCPTATSA